MKLDPLVPLLKTHGEEGLEMWLPWWPRIEVVERSLLKSYGLQKPALKNSLSVCGSFILVLEGLLKKKKKSSSVCN